MPGSMPTADTLAAQLDRLASLEPGPFPVVSLYLNAQADQHGRDNFEPFLRKELPERLQTYPAEGPERKSLEQDAEKIAAYLGTVDASANGLVIFASSGANLFEAIQLAVPIEHHRLYVSAEPHLYPLARILDQNPRYAVLVADTNLSRIFVVAANAVEASEQVTGTKTRRHKMGGWSQARYQRHIENYHKQHVKEVVDTLARLVRDEAIASVIVAGDDVAVPLVREELPKDVAERVVDVVKLDARSGDREIVDATVELMRRKDAETDRESVDALIGAYRGDGLACVGVEATRTALEMGQVDELVITAAPETIDAGKTTEAAAGEPTSEERVADELVAKARQTAATIRFIEDPALLAAVGGVGAFLRFKL
jgi:peptide chain release factor subunit 1